MSAGFTGTSFAIALNGAPVVEALSRAATLIVIRRELGAPAVAELDFDLSDPALAEGVAIGQALTITVRPSGRTVFAGEVAGVSYHYTATEPPVLRLRAYDVLQNLRRTFRPRLLETVSAASLAADLAADLGIASRCTTDPPTRTAVLQHEQSDFDLLADLAADAGLYPVLQDDTLLLTALDGEGAPLDLQLGAALVALDAGLHNDRNQRGTVAAGWDVSTARAFAETVTTARIDAVEMRDTGADAGAAGYRQRLNRLADQEAEVQALAAADLDRTVAQAVMITGTCLGNPDLAPGRLINLTGVAPAVAGLHVLTGTTHRISAETGFLTDFSSAPPSRAARPLRPLATLGEVTDTADPERLGRCRVRLPALGGTQSVWMQVMIAAAGEGKGLAAFPEVDDKVLVLCPDGDPARGIVLGSLYGEARLPSGLSAGSPRPFILRTGGGQRLELSSTEAMARLATSAGSLLELLPGRARLATVTDLVIEAPGRTITFRANFINFERI